MSGERAMTKYISICGPLASGKTTLTRLLQDEWGWHGFYEDLDSHPYFKLYYSDVKKWGFHTVIYFLIRALEMQVDIRNVLQTISVCQDWSFYEHFRVYGEHVYREGIIDERDYRTCSKLNKILEANLQKPDVTICLFAGAETLLNRVNTRHRDGEGGQVPISYIEKLLLRYNDFYTSLTTPNILIDTEKLDFIHDHETKLEVLRRVQDALGEI